MSNPEFNLASLLDGTLDDLADRPEFRPFVQGLHAGKLTLSQDDKAPHIFFAEFILSETVEQVDPNEEPMEPGKSKCRARYDLSNEYGQGDMKVLLIAAKEATGKTSNLELIEYLKGGVECKVVTSNREDKKSGKVYTSISECVID